MTCEWIETLDGEKEANRLYGPMQTMFYSDNGYVEVYGNGNQTAWLFDGTKRTLLVRTAESMDPKSIKILANALDTGL